MKVIIAGSRHLTTYELVKKAVKLSGFEITEVVSGHAPGIDLLGERWAEDNIGKDKIKKYPADWHNLDVPRVRIKFDKFGRKYNANAGFARNSQMAQYADALIAITTGTPGTGDMIEKMKALGKKVYVHRVAHH